MAHMSNSILGSIWVFPSLWKLRHKCRAGVLISYVDHGGVCFTCCPRLIGISRENGNTLFRDSLLTTGRSIQQLNT